MSLKKRGEFWHYDFTIGGRRYRGSTQLRSKADARALEDAKRRSAAVGETRAIPTLERVAALWFDARVEGRKSVVTTAQRVKIALRLIGPQTPINAIGAREVAEAIGERRHETTRQSLKAPRAPSNATVNRDLIDSTLRPILRYARRVLEVEGVKEIDWAELRLPEPKGRSRSFTGDELAAWRAELPAWHRPVFDFFARHGVRLAEVFFPLEAIDLAEAEVTIRTRKNGLPHVVTLLEDEARDMAARLGRARAGGLRTVWFREMASGQLRAIEPRGFQSASRSALERAAIKDARPVHDLRHHAATILLRSSGNLRLVQELLGHESMTSTQRYAHVAREDRREALRRAHVTTGAETAATPSPATDRTGT